MELSKNSNRVSSYDHLSKLAAVKIRFNMVDGEPALRSKAKEMGYEDVVNALNIQLQARLDSAEPS